MSSQICPSTEPQMRKCSDALAGMTMPPDRWIGLESSKRPRERVPPRGSGWGGLRDWRASRAHFLSLRSWPQPTLWCRRPARGHWQTGAPVCGVLPYTPEGTTEAPGNRLQEGLTFCLHAFVSSTGPFFQTAHTRGTRVAQSVTRPTLGFGSGHSLTVREFEPRVGLCADSSEPGACFGFCVSLSLCPSPAHALPVCLSLSQKKK